MLNPSFAFASFVAHEFPVSSPPPCPEIQLHLGNDLAQSWAATESHVGRPGLPPPYWSVAWPGGLALARLLLDHPDLVRGRRVLDLGSGSGLCAIAAAISGAASVVAVDIDPVACMAVEINAGRNSVAVEVVCADLIGSEAARWDVVLGADLWYERFLAQRVNAWLRELSTAGVEVLVGDLGRAYLPRAGLVQLGSCEVTSSQGVEREAVSRAFAYRWTPAGGTGHRIAERP